MGMMLGSSTDKGARDALVHHRVELMEELYERYGSPSRGGGRARSFRFWRKKYAWNTIIGSAKALKRATDIVGSIMLMIMLSPLLLLIALLIKLTDRGAVFFWQTRVGRWGAEFQFPKFRSMIPDAERHTDSLLGRNHHGASVTFKMKDDPRITWIGQWIRRSSLDELPQLWCVLKGEMSLVGPRPPLPREVALYTLADRRRLDVTPGLTCIWQVSGRGDLPFPQQVELDIQYIESQSLWLDVKLLLQTIPAVLFGRGAY